MADYESLKVPELKALLKERSLPQSGRKADLISRLQGDDAKQDGPVAEEKRPLGAAEPEEARPRDAEKQPMQNGDADGGTNKLPAGPKAADAAPADSVAGGDASVEHGLPAKAADQPPCDADNEDAAAVKVDSEAALKASSGVEASAPASAGDELGGEHGKDDHLASKDPLAAPAEGPASQREDGPTEPVVNGDAPPAEPPAKNEVDAPPAESPAKAQGEAPPAEAPANDLGDAPPASPVKDQTDAALPETRAKDQDDAQPADSPAKAPAPVPAKSAEQPGDSDSLSLDDTDSEQHDPKADAQAAADSARSQQQPAHLGSSPPPGRSHPAAKPGPAEPPRSAAAPEGEPRQPGGSADAAAAPAPAAKRKHADIVFPDAPAPAERPAPAKREKVDLVVPEATHETRALRIGGLKRPLREADLKQILAKTGAIDGFWIDSCKTHCYVVYGTVEEARETRAAVDGLQWPPRCRSVMQPRYVSLEEAQGMIDSKGAATLTRVPSTAADLPAPAAKPADSAGEAVIDMTKAAAAAEAPPPRPARADASQVAAGGSTPAEMTPLELFELTEAQPSLYWLPLTEDQVAQRRGVDAARRARAAAAAAVTGADADAGEADADMDEDPPAGGGSDAGEDGQGDAAARGAAGSGGEGADGAQDGVQDGDVEMVDPGDDKAGSDD